MNHAAATLFRGLGRLWSRLFSPRTCERVTRMKRVLYSAWIAGEFKAMGKDCVIYSFQCLVGAKYISIGDRCVIGENTFLTAWDRFGTDTFQPEIIIGNHVSIGDDSHITAIRRIEIGDNVLTGKKITITDNSHGKNGDEMLSVPPSARPLYSAGPVIVEDGVWLGDKVTILPNVRIGKNAIIGANAVVADNIPANCVAGGIPAKVLKFIAS